LGECLEFNGLMWINKFNDSYYRCYTGYMKSKWYELKEKATNLRKRGFSMGKIEHSLGIPRSTLSGWLKNVKLSKKQKKLLLQAQKNGLVSAREKAAQWHHKEKVERFLKTERKVEQTLKKVSRDDKIILDLTLAILYMGEGFKKTIGTGIGNSDPLILKFFITALQKNYQFDKFQIKCELHLRVDQNPERIKRFWARKLELPLKNFTYITVDKRTNGSKTYPSYKGVCVLRCGNVDIQRRLMLLSQKYFEKVIGEK